VSELPGRHEGELASYVLGEMDEHERREFERVLAADPALAAEADQLRLLVGRLDAVEDDAWALPEPPPLRLEPDPIVSAHDEPRRRVDAPGTRESLWTRWFGGGLRPALAAALAALVFAGGLVVGSNLDDDPGGEQFAAASSATLQPVGELQPAARGEARIEASGEKMRIRVTGLDPSDAGDFYEAWMMNSEQGLVSLGAFTVGADGSAEIQVPVPVSAADFPVVDISLEPADGIPAHSGKSVLRAELA
jgi:anti-sigma-K factor RskA